MGTTAEKLAYLKETKSQIKQALETPSNVMRDYANWIKKYVDNQPTQVVTDGVCTNALDVPLVSMGVDGQSVQKQYKGYNLLPYLETQENDGVEFSQTKDGIKVNGTNLDISSNITIFNGTLDEGTYIINGLPNGSGNTYQLVVYKNNSLLGYVKISDFKFNLTESTTIRIDIYVYQAYGVFNNLILPYMLVKGTTMPDTYEPYTGGQPLPNPEYPQDIEVIDGCNMIDMSKAIKNYYINEASGATLSASSSYNAFATDFIKVNQGDYIYYSGYKNTNSGNTGAYYDKDKNYLGKITRDVDIAPFIVPEGCKFIRLSIWGNKYETPTNPKPVLVKGTTPKPYLPYGCIGLRHSGKQELNLNAVTTSIKNVVFTVNNDKTVLANGTNDGTGNSQFFLTRTQIFKKGTYILSGCPGGGRFTNYRIGIQDQQYNTLAVDSGSGATFTLTKDKILNVFIIVQNGATVNNLLFKPMIRLANISDDTYEPYHEPKVIPINLNGNYISKVGDVKDLLKIYRNGDVEILDKIKHIVSYNGETITTDYISNTGGLNTGSEIYYKGDEEIIKLPSIAPIQLWEGTNHFKLITNLDTTFEMEYVVNKNSVLNEVQEALLNAEPEI